MIISQIPQLVKRKGLSLSELSRRAGLSNLTVVKLYYADFTSIHINVLDKLCRALGASPGDLFVYVPGEESKYPALSDAVLGEHPRNKRAGRAEVASTDHNNQQGKGR